MLVEKVTIPKIYSAFADDFSKKSAIKLPQRSNINKHVINLKPNKHLLYKQIYSLSQIELKTLKTYIENYLANSFICPFESPTRALILFVSKQNSSLYLYVNYYGPNNFTIKN